MFDGDDPELLDLISDRVAVIYDMLYEDVEDDEAEEEYPVDPARSESLSEIDKELLEEEDEETEDDDEDEEYEDINDLDEDIIE